MGTGRSSTKRKLATQRKQLSFTKTNWQHRNQQGGVLSN